MYQNKRDISSLRAAYYFDTVIKKDKNRRFVNIDDNYKIKTSRSGRSVCRIILNFKRYLGL